MNSSVFSGCIIFPADEYLWYSIDRIFYCIKKEAIASLNESIKFHLNIEDPNIIFSDYFKKWINGKYHNLYLAELIQPHCPYCHSSNLKHNGHYTSNVRFITADASHPVIIRLKKQRVLCDACLKRSMAQSNLINKGCYISNTSKRKILSALLSSMMILIIYLNT